MNEISNRQCVACSKARDRQKAIDYVNHSRTLPAGRYTSYKTGAKRRNIEFYLTIEEFTTMWMEPCTYCGSDINTIGVDRVDNTRGYTIDNVVPCCKLCNESKKAKPLNEWLDHMVKIINNIKK